MLNLEMDDVSMILTSWTRVLRVARGAGRVAGAAGGDGGVPAVLRGRFTEATTTASLAVRGWRGRGRGRAGSACPAGGKGAASVRFRRLCASLGGGSTWGGGDPRERGRAGRHGRRGDSDGRPGAGPHDATVARLVAGPVADHAGFVTICARLIGVEVGRAPTSIVGRFKGP